MKPYLILIDLKSIKKNPNAGSTITHIPTKKEIRFSAEVLPDYFIDGENCFIEEWREFNGKIVDCNGILFGDYESLIQKLIEERPNGVTISMHQDVQQIYHFPESDYFFDYLPIEIHCENCNTKFTSDLLEYEDNDDPNYFAFSNKVCPNCGEWDCCEFIYEDIKDALIRKEKENEML